MSETNISPQARSVNTTWAKEEYSRSVVVIGLTDRLYGIYKLKQLNRMFSLAVLCWRWTIFPARLQASIFASAELNFCVRNGNRWTLCVRSTDFWCILKDSTPRCIAHPHDQESVARNCHSFILIRYGAPSGIRTRDPLIKSQLLYQLS